MKKYFFPALLIIVIFGIAMFIISPKKTIAPKNLPSLPKPQTASSSPSPVIKDEILKNALNLYIQKKKEGVDMSNGPCLGKIGDDWVLDIAHNPRLPVDDKPENQCADFREGKAHHFVELDPNGNLIRIY